MRFLIESLFWRLPTSSADAPLFSVLSFPDSPQAGVPYTLIPQNVHGYRSYGGSAVDAEGRKTLALNFAGDFDFNGDIAVTLKGGYDCMFSYNSRMTQIQGSIVITSGSVVFENVEIQ